MQVLFVAVLTITDGTHHEIHKFVLGQHLTFDDRAAAVASGQAAILTNGICQVALARHDPGLERVLPGRFMFKPGVWLAVHENLRSIPRCRVMFDGLADGLKTHVDRPTTPRKL
jgi:hypothetical protein